MTTHYHADERGVLVRCLHQCRSWLSPGFLAGWWVANTITFPLEHVQWDHIWPFYYVGEWLDQAGELQRWISYIWLVSFVVSVVFGLRYVVRQKNNT